MSAHSERPAEFAARYTAAWCSQDPFRVAACYSIGGSLSINEGIPAVGRSAIAEVAGGFMAAFPDLRVQMDDVCVDGDRVVYRWTLTGINSGPAGSGRPVCISGSEVWKMSGDGLIAESDGQFDAADYQRQLRGENSR